MTAAHGSKPYSMSPWCRNPRGLIEALNECVAWGGLAMDSMSFSRREVPVVAATLGLRVWMNERMYEVGLRPGAYRLIDCSQVFGATADDVLIFTKGEDAMFPEGRHWTWTSASRALHELFRWELHLIFGLNLYRDENPLHIYG